MTETDIILLVIVAGMVFRRWWGGCGSPNSTVKRIVGVLLPLSVCLYIFSFSWITLVLTVGCSFAWMMPKHGYGIGMGNGSAQRDPMMCFFVMDMQYAGLTHAMGLAWYLLEGSPAGIIYSQLGHLVPIAYLLSWKYLKNFKLGSFIDGPTAIGELVLGASILGGIPLSESIANML